MNKKDERILQFFRNKGVNIFNEMPKGWRVLKGTLTQPNGYVWACNGKGLFEKDENGNRLYKHALVKIY